MISFALFGSSFFFAPFLLCRQTLKLWYSEAADEAKNDFNRNRALTIDLPRRVNDDLINEAIIM